jgi:H+/Cl- antiporter ClcA
MPSQPQSDHQALPLIVPVLMIGTWLGAMVTIKMLIAPWIVGSYGFIGVAVTLAALLAFAKWLDH